MSINDPILEMLSFAVDADLNISSATSSQPEATSTSSSCPEAASSSSSLGNSTTTTTAQSDIREPAKKSSTGENNDFVKSSVLLGEEQEIPCLFPTCSYRTCGSIDADKKLLDEFLAHLLAEHKVVIEYVEEIGNWSKYLSHWRGKLVTGAITDFCVGFVMDELPKVDVRKPKKQNEGQSSGSKDESNLEKGLESKTVKDGASGSEKTDNMYFMLMPVLPEDRQLRKKLWNQRLDVVLQVNHQEREDTCFSRRCLFCRDVVTGNRTEYFTHMRDSHHFHMGQPDNLVFIKELLQLIEEKLNRLECLFCEHVFKDKAVLKEHMRKKQHRQLNPKNSAYDRFYIVNYLEPGKTWETIQLEDTEDERKEDEWIEPTEEEKERNVVCLFCKVANSAFSNILDHMKTDHKFDFLSITETLDFYQKIKLVNFIRRTVYQNACLCCEKRCQDHASLLLHFQLDHDVQDFENVLLLTKQWNQPEYFFSTYDNDDFLTCLDSDDNVMKDDAVSSEDESNVIPEDLPHIDMTNREFDLAGFAIRYHNQSS